MSAPAALDSIGRSKCRGARRGSEQDGRAAAQRALRNQSDRRRQKAAAIQTNSMHTVMPHQAPYYERGSAVITDDATGVQYAIVADPVAGSDSAASSTGGPGPQLGVCLSVRNAGLLQPGTLL